MRELLKSKGKVEAVATELGVNRSYISMIRTGKMNPSKKVCDYLGIEKVVTYRRKNGENSQ